MKTAFRCKFALWGRFLLSDEGRNSTLCTDYAKRFQRIVPAFCNQRSALLVLRFLLYRYTLSRALFSMNTRSGQQFCPISPGARRRNCSVSAAKLQVASFRPRYRKSSAPHVAAFTSHVPNATQQPISNYDGRAGKDHRVCFSKPGGEKAWNMITPRR